ncbi:kinase-like domain-containing protein [Aspergillus californicus]
MDYLPEDGPPASLEFRFVRFDLTALIRVAEEAAGLPEGNFNKSFLATMRDGQELVVKIPNLNTAPAHYTTASEVATLQYEREILDLPVPRVLAYCTQGPASKVGAEYIITTQAPGIELGRVWDSLKPREKLSLAGRIASITSVSTKLEDTFAIGPTTSQSWFYDRRGEVRTDRGPWNNSAQTMLALLATFPLDCQQGIFNGPAGYHPTKEAKRAVPNDFVKIYKYILPQDNTFNRGMLWHNDLHSDNIFVDKDYHNTITCIIDWQAVSVYAAFLIAHHPSIIDFDGPKPQRFVEPTLPDNIHTLNHDDKRAAKKSYLAQTLWLYYETKVAKEAPSLSRAFQYRDTIVSELLSLIGSVFDDGEPHVQKLLAQITSRDNWNAIVGKDEVEIPCPLQYTEEDLAAQNESYSRWERDVERKARIFNEIGVYTGWNGAVSPADYQEVVRRLEVAKGKFLVQESRSAEERAQWEEAWAMSFESQ